MRLSTKYARPMAAAAMAVSMFSGVMAHATTASAAPKAPAGLDRKAVIARAKTWTKAKVPYSQTGYKGGYRRDCSGFVAYAWNLPENLVTWNIPTVAKQIKKDQLQPGDVLLNTKRNRHVVMFEKWANKSKTKYWVLEQTGQSGVDRAIRREMTYPYRIDAGLYKAYRYKSMAGYYKEVPSGSRQPVKGYKLVTKPKAKPAVKKATPKPVAPKPVAKQTAPKTTTTVTPKPVVTRDAGSPQGAAETAARPGFLGALFGWLSAGSVR